jgi:Domain of unknown function (DUF2017)
MEFYSISGSRLGLRGIPPLLASLMRQIPGLFEQDSSVAEERLFPSPSHDPQEQALREDWKAHVEPELHTLFLSARQVVEADLRGFQETDGNYSLEFPAAHAESWLNALNQARLCLAAQHHLQEAELSQMGPIAIVSERDLARLQIHFYAALQQWLVEILDTA